MLLALVPSRETPQVVAQLLQRQPEAVMGEDHRQRRRSALRRLHLEDGRRLTRFGRAQRSVAPLGGAGLAVAGTAQLTAPDC